MRPLLLALISGALSAQSLETWITSVGGFVESGADGTIQEVSLARTWTGDNDLQRILELRSLKKLDLSFTYVTDKGIELIPQFKELEELTLDTAEFITDAAINHLRANKKLRKLVLRGTDITDVALPYIGELRALRTLDLSHSMLGDVGIESLVTLTELEELDLGATRITGINLHLLKLLPKLKRLSFKGIQRRNGGACWTPTIVDRDMESLALLTGLEELNLGAGLGLGVQTPGSFRGETNCRLTGGIKLTDLGVGRLKPLKSLRALELSGAGVTPSGLKVLAEMPKLERLSLWNCRTLDDSVAPVLAGLPMLRTLDLSDTAITDAGLAMLKKLDRIYLTDTKVTAAAADTYRAAKPGRYVSWAMRPQ